MSRRRQHPDRQQEPDSSWPAPGDPAIPTAGIAPIRDILPGGGAVVPPQPSLPEWLAALPGLPRAIDRVVPVGCHRHEGEPRPLSRVEADPVAGVARRRCEACDDAVFLLDAAERWTAPPLWACPSCSHAEVELAAGLSLPDGARVDWVVLVARCTTCHHMAGLTDVILDHEPLSQVLSAL